MEDLLERCHTLIWLSCLEPIIESEKRNQEYVEKLLEDICKVIYKEK